MGGVRFLQAICAPYRQVHFIPTGGIDPHNLGSYLALPQVVACGGSWMVNSELMSTGQFDRIAELANEAVNLVKAERERVNAES
jgi:2-dehydro-3-deoxyphosphogluconate aldolase/(4S)-4-hydroxy-2-oxoglutarate aldolase